MITVITDYSLDNITIFPVDAPFHFSIKKHFLKKATVLAASQQSDLFSFQDSFFPKLSFFIIIVSIFK